MESALRSRTSSAVRGLVWTARAIVGGRDALDETNTDEPRRSPGKGARPEAGEGARVEDEEAGADPASSSNKRRGTGRGGSLNEAAAAETAEEEEASRGAGPVSGGRSNFTASFPLTRLIAPTPPAPPVPAPPPRPSEPSPGRATMSSLAARLLLRALRPLQQEKQGQHRQQGRKT